MPALHGSSVNSARHGATTERNRQPGVLANTLHPAVSKPHPLQRRKERSINMKTVPSAKASFQSGPTSSPVAAASSAGLGLFPAGQKQATVDLPSLMLQLEAAECTGTGSKTVMQKVNEAVSAGATAIVLVDTGKQAGDAKLFDAAVKLKEALRGRASLLMVDRTDLASVAGADGLLLTGQGVPIAVAQRILKGSMLIGRACSSAEEAVAQAAEGANFLLLSNPDGSFPPAAALLSARKNQRSGNAIPVLAAAGISSATAATASAAAVKPLAADCWDKGSMDGLALPLSALQLVAAAASGAEAKGGKVSAKEVGTAAGLLLERMRQLPLTPGGTGGVGGGSAMQRRLHSNDREQLVQEESALLTRVLTFLELAAPEMGELQLLKDSLAQLDDAFLAVVVGEFNSGKSSLINALLGGRFLAEGILPTTNEISILKHRPPAPKGTKQEPEMVQQADGLFVRYLPARLLEELHIVDTPGTNVILSRQQRLTEEYVPRADLVLFVMSADRPFSESEVKFLEYIRQWKKKIVFVINKSDLLQEETEIDQVKSFVTSNASRLLKLDAPAVLAVSSRAALRAKLTSGSGSGSSSGTYDSSGASGSSYDGDDGATYNGISLGRNQEWINSGFAEFEAFIYSFLVGSGATEGLRLKLQTPVAVADALMAATGRKLAVDLESAKSELEALKQVSAQLDQFETDMAKDSQTQGQALEKILDEARGRSDRFIDRTLQLTKIIGLLPYLTGESKQPSPLRARFETEVVGTTIDDFKAAVMEHSSWLRRNCESQNEYYSSFMDEKARSLGLAGSSRRGGRNSSSLNNFSMGSLTTRSYGTVSDSDAEAPQTAEAAEGEAASSSTAGGTTAVAVRGAPSASASLVSASGSSSGSGTTSLAAASPAMAAVQEFNVRAAATLLDQELRESLTGTAGAAVGAPSLGVLTASFLPSTAEDLIVLGLGGAVSYLAVLDMPKRRAETKDKVTKLAKNFVAGVVSKMEEEMKQQVGAVTESVRGMLQPLLSACTFEVKRLEDLEEKRVKLSAELAELDRRFADIQ